MFPDGYCFECFDADQMMKDQAAPSVRGCHWGAGIHSGHKDLHCSDGNCTADDLAGFVVEKMKTQCFVELDAVLVVVEKIDTQRFVELAVVT